MLYIFILWLTKCSVALLFIRLTPEQKHIFASYVVLGGSTLLMVVSEILVALRCDMSHPWIFVDNGCGDLVSLNSIISLFHPILPPAPEHSPRTQTTWAERERQTNTPHKFQRWQVVTAFDVITEVLLFSLAMYMLQGLKLKIEKKLVVLSAFALRLP